MSKSTKKPFSQSKQSTNHILLVEPAVFYANPETMQSNVYQVENQDPPEVVLKQALLEFHKFAQMLTENGIAVTVVRGSEECPDHIFPNWMSTHRSQGERGQLVLYPMVNENRRKERTPGLVGFLKHHYDLALDFTPFEVEGLFLEANGSLCLDRVNRVAYAALSNRTSEVLVQKWAEATGYDVEIFQTQGAQGKPVYHTDLVMWVGSDVAAICADCIAEPYREKVLKKLKAMHKVVELSFDQLNHFCGNSLEVCNIDGEKLLVMSSTAYNALTDVQINTLETHFKKILHNPIPTIEKYGGGSARCLILEMF